MKEFIKRNRLAIIGCLIGALAGFLYWDFIGCASGHCLITSRPLNSTLYGMVMGGLLFSMFEKPGRRGQPKSKENK